MIQNPVINKTFSRSAALIFVALSLLITGLVGVVAGQKGGRHPPQLRPVAVEFGRATIPNGGQCITYTGYFTDDFFLDIQVRRSKGAVEFWKDSSRVTSFPSTTTVLLHVLEGNCNPNVIQLAPSIDHGHISGLTFKESWLKGETGEEIRQADHTTVEFSPSPSWRESGQVWGQYKLTVSSDGLSISDTFKICILEANKERSCLNGNLKNSVWIHEDGSPRW